MLERSLFLIPGVTYLGGGKRGNLWLYPLLIVTSLRYLSACSDGNSLSFPFSPVFVRYNCQPTRGVSPLFHRSNSAFSTLWPAWNCLSFYRNTDSLDTFRYYKRGSDFLGFFFGTDTEIGFCDFFSGEILFLKY